MINFTAVPSEERKNYLEILFQESHTNVNEHDEWTGVTRSFYEDVTKEEAGVIVRCFQICEKEFDISRNAYGGHGLEYNALELDEKEEYFDEFDDIQVDSQYDMVTFTKDGKEYHINYNYDMGMPTEDARYFAGLKFHVAFYYDENGNKFKIEY